MAPHAHTLRINIDYLESTLATLCGQVLSCSSLKMEPDISGMHGQDGMLRASMQHVSAATRMLDLLP